jgi:ribosomal protein S18 acetylase RimI-like enzyme
MSPSREGSPRAGAGAPAALRIRAARREEGCLIRELAQRAYEGYIASIGVRPPPMDADYPTAIARGQAFVAIDGGIAGVIVLCPQSDHLLIDNVAVDPSSQGRGIGRSLLDFAEHRARALGLPRVRLYTHERMGRNLRLYSRLGYELQPRTGDGPRPRVLLAKELS